MKRKTPLGKLGHRGEGNMRSDNKHGIIAGKWTNVPFSSEFVVSEYRAFITCRCYSARSICCFYLNVRIKS